MPPKFVHIKMLVHWCIQVTRMPLLLVEYSFLHYKCGPSSQETKKVNIEVVPC